METLETMIEYKHVQQTSFGERYDCICSCASVGFCCRVTLCVTSREATVMTNERNRTSARMLHSVARVSYTKNRVTGNISDIRVRRAL